MGDIVESPAYEDRVGEKTSKRSKASKLPDPQRLNPESIPLLYISGTVPSMPLDIPRLGVRVLMC